jgi:sterol desaturase/sphingolipid hydroxylase (fatty acid hydroxylase superfamily)
MAIFTLFHESTLRLGFFITMLAIMMIAELGWPKRHLLHIKKRRWFSNLSLVFISSMTLRLLLPAGAISAAIWSADHHVGLLHLIQFPNWLSTFLSILILDIAIYLQHLVFHKNPLLWRLHKVHHADPDIDVTTGLRFHPLEILLSLGFKIVVIMVFGIPAFAVLLFEILLNAMAMFNHSNVRLPYPLDRLIRKLLVTPDMHRVHHSIEYTEMNSNFGFNLACWDKLFKTYVDQPALGHLGMKIGLPEFSNIKKASQLYMMIVMPFLNRIKK